MIEKYLNKEQNEMWQEMQNNKQEGYTPFYFDDNNPQGKPIYQKEDLPKKMEGFVAYANVLTSSLS